MRLSHWDFRPKQRRKYVAPGSADSRSGSRKRPALRILLLAAAGTLVYLKYDAVVHSSLLDELKHPRRLWQDAWTRLRETTVRAPAQGIPAYSPDSTWMEWTCASSRRDSCLEAWGSLDAKEKGAIRAALGKALLQGGFPEPSSFTAAFHRSPSGSPLPEFQEPSGASGASSESAGRLSRGDWELLRLGLRSGNRSLAWVALPEASGALRWCIPPPDGAARCPAEPGPNPPLRRFAAAELGLERPPVLAFRTQREEAIHPVLPGRILDLPQGLEGWLKVHHGGTLFSYYSGIVRMHPGLAAGGTVGVEDTLGFAGRDSSGTQATAAPEPVPAVALPALPEDGLRLRIEKDGSPVDPMAFLGMEPVGPGDSYGR